MINNNAYSTFYIGNASFPLLKFPGLFVLLFQPVYPAHFLKPVYILLYAELFATNKPEFLWLHLHENVVAAKLSG